MTKRKNYNTQLLALGVLIPELHYGRHAREWWVSMTGTNLIDNGLFPLRVGQKIAVELNGRQFITRIIHENNIPNYCHDKKTIIQELLLEIPFHPFKVEYNKHQICLGTSKYPDFFGADSAPEEYNLHDI
ncbi:13339_t:CDS:2 [Dentiscutata heterogama]|uniref:13339_t:CDS:1 n=1 Tax=Dentiscutata heterogama TaxID=1316150 RepID=A0ACA9MBZ3_9GLOM|nr:13339_t:CDS:2 [Dentiscutata heterogama]